MTPLQKYDILFGKDPDDYNLLKWTVVAIIIAIVFMMFCVGKANAETLQASWYSTASLHRDGQWKLTKGVMANGNTFLDNNFTCATWLFPLNSYVLVRNLLTGRAIQVKVTDRINRRFAKTRIDLSKGAFSKIANCKQGTIPITVELITKGKK